jgi:hypothetical protein
MKSLATYLSSLLTAVIAWLVKRGSAQMLRYVAYFAAVIALLMSLFLVLKGLVEGMVFFVNNEYLVMGFWIFWPGNAEMVLSAMITTDISIFVYRLHLKQLAEFYKAMQVSG